MTAKIIRINQTGGMKVLFSKRLFNNINLTLLDSDFNRTNKSSENYYFDLIKIKVRYFETKEEEDVRVYVTRISGDMMYFQLIFKDYKRISQSKVNNI